MQRIEQDWSKFPKILYKYRSWSDDYHKRMLTKKEIYFPRISQLNDPFEFKFKTEYNEPDRDTVELRIVQDQLSRGNNDMTPEWLDQAVDNAPIFNENATRQYTKRMVHELYNDARIFSLCNSNDNLLLWSYYADSHRGFCVGFDHESLRRHIKGMGGPVNYMSELPSISNSNLEESEDKYLEDLILIALSKSNQWKHENEARIVVIPTNSPLNDGKITVPIEAIKEVIFGCKMSECDKEAIRNAVQVSELNVRFFQAVLNNERFQLDITPLEG